MSKRIDYSCQHFDSAIASIEKARDINSDLRDALETQTKRAEEAEAQVETLEGQAADLETRISELEAEIDKLEKQGESVAA